MSNFISRLKAAIAHIAQATPLPQQPINKGEAAQAVQPTVVRTKLVLEDILTAAALSKDSLSEGFILPYSVAHMADRLKAPPEDVMEAVRECSDRFPLLVRFTRVTPNPYDFPTLEQTFVTLPAYQAEMLRWEATLLRDPDTAAMPIWAGPPWQLPECSDAAQV